MLSRSAFFIFFEKLKSHPFAFSGIVLGNLLPLYAVVYEHWKLFDVFYLYWAENIVIGVLTLMRLVLAGAREGLGGVISAVFLGAFFVLHYGLFCMAHGMIMTEAFFIPTLDKNADFILTESSLFMLPWLTGMSGFTMAFCGIVLAEFIYQTRLWLNERRKPLQIGRVMMAPYGRIIILHVTILFGGLLAQSLGFPPAALGFLIVLKIFYDMGLFACHIQTNEKEDHVLA